ASTAAGYALAGLPFPENAIAQTLIGQTVNIGSYVATSGSGPKVSPYSPTTKTFSNGWVQTTQKLPQGGTETTVSEQNGTSLTTMTSKSGTTELLKNIDGSGKMVVTPPHSTTVTNIDRDGKVTTTTLPTGAKPPTLLQVP